METIFFLSVDNSLRIKFMLLKWYRLFRASKFKEAMWISEELIDITCNNSTYDEEILGEIYHQYALAMKYLGYKTYNGIYKRAKNNYPDSSVIKIEFLSNKGNRLLKTKPLQAAECYKQAVSFALGKPKLLFSFLHQSIDIGMSFFVAERYEEASKHLQRAYEQSIVFGNFMQQGRAANILGCIYLIDNEINTAEYYFKLSFSLLESQGADIFSWRPLANLIALYVDKDKKLCYANIKKLIGKLDSDFEQRTLNDKNSSTYIMYLAIIYYLNQLQYYEQAKKIAKKMNIPFDSPILIKNTKEMLKLFNCKVKYIKGYFCAIG